ncbi:MAG TPA: hypothetical protein VFO67_03405 [Gemmatimonadales bacterium]|nr:hypothetical protein [Gemmatimonadales bacterium]
MTGNVLLLLLQGVGWSVAPASPTVGDTIRVERTIDAPAGWRVRAGKLEQNGDVEQLGDPSIIARANGFTVRYLLVAWRAGSGSVTMPSLWRLGPDGSTDSVPGGSVTLNIASVIPDTITAPQPQPSLGPLRWGRTNAIPVIAAVLLAGGLLAALVMWRRRGPRRASAESALETAGEIADQRWLAAGEPKAVAARATQRLRRALAHAIPDAHEALSTTEVLAAVERARPDAPLRDLRDLLQALDQVAFATAHGVDVAPLAARARAFARELRPNGGKSVT